MYFEYGDYTLEGRVAKWMKAQSRKMNTWERQCEKKIDAMPELVEPDYQGPEELIEAFEKEEERRNDLYMRKGRSKEEWKAYRTELYRQEQKFWKEYHAGIDEDFDNAYILKILHFKLRWMVFYWDNFGHCMNGWHVSRQMKLAMRLIEIILNDGFDTYKKTKLPYVNVRNKDRFYGFKDWHQPCYYEGIKQEVRFRKAYCLFFNLLKQNLLSWWD